MGRSDIWHTLHNVYRTIKFSCTVGVSYALFISLLISKLFCRMGWVGGGGWVRKIRLRYIINLIRTRSPPLIQLGEGGPLAAVGPETHVHKITSVLVFYMALGLNNFNAAHPFLGPLEGGGPWKPWLFGPKWHFHLMLPFQAQKSFHKQEVH